MLPAPPASRGKHDQKRNPEVLKDDKSLKHEHMPTPREKATASIKQNSTNEGSFRGRRES